MVATGVVEGVDASKVILKNKGEASEQVENKCNSLARAGARKLSLPKAVAAAGGITAWNDATVESTRQWRMIDNMCQPTTVAEAEADVDAILALGHQIWAYSYVRPRPVQSTFTHSSHLRAILPLRLAVHP